MREFIMRGLMLIGLLCGLAIGTTSCTKNEPNKKPVATNVNYLGAIANVYKTETIKVKQIGIKQNQEAEKFLQDK